MHKSRKIKVLIVTAYNNSLLKQLLSYLHLLHLVTSANNTLLELMKLDCKAHFQLSRIVLENLILFLPYFRGHSSGLSLNKSTPEEALELNDIHGTQNHHNAACLIICTL